MEMQIRVGARMMAQICVWKALESQGLLWRRTRAM